MYQWPFQVTLINSRNTDGSPAELGFFAHDFPEEPPQEITIYDVSWVKTDPKLLGPISNQESEPSHLLARRVCYRSTSPVTAGFRRYLNNALTGPYSTRRLAIQAIN